MTRKHEQAAPALMPLLAGLCAFAFALVAEFTFVGPAWTAAALRAVFALIWLWIGFPVLGRAVSSIASGRFFNENTLMALATVGAFAIDAFSEAAGVMVFYRLGEYFEARALERSRRSIQALVSIKPTIVHLARSGALVDCLPEEAGVGDEFYVRPGERVPLDGVVTEGRSTLDTSAVTGESMPRPVGPGDEAISGSVNGSGGLSLRVARTYENSQVARILRLVEEALASKSGTERFITRFARSYTPGVLSLALLVAVLPPLFVPGASFSDWLHRALVILVISCPCALVISIPLGYVGGIGGAARRGVLVKGSTSLDRLAALGAVVFDKTGTLTQGAFRLTGIETSDGFSEDGLLELAARAEAGSNHPVAAALRRAHGRDLEVPAEFAETSGRGVAAKVDGRLVLVGSAAFLRENGLTPPEALGHGRSPTMGVDVFVGVDGRFAGRLRIADQIKADAREALDALRAAGISRFAILSGDEPPTTGVVAERLGIEEAWGGLLPADKLARLEEIKKATAGAVAFVGDGINDAPVLAAADVGLAMGSLGSDAAVETADVVLMNDELSTVALAVETARMTRAIVRQNIVLALGVKLFFVVGGVAGLAGMWEAVFADVGVTVLAVLNSSRALGGRPSRAA